MVLEWRELQLVAEREEALLGDNLVIERLPEQCASKKGYEKIGSIEDIGFVLWVCSVWHR